MNSLSFPNMFTSARTVLLKDHEATMTNLKLLLLSDKNSLFADPYFGTELKKVLFEQNNVVLRDLVIDSIYTAIRVFMPQLQLSRNNIKIKSDGVDVIAEIQCINHIDYKTDLFSIKLTDPENARYN